LERHFYGRGEKLRRGEDHQRSGLVERTVLFSMRHLSRVLFYTSDDGIRTAIESHLRRYFGRAEIKPIVPPISDAEFGSCDALVFHLDDNPWSATLLSQLRMAHRSIAILALGPEGRADTARALGADNLVSIDAIDHIAPSLLRLLEDESRRKKR
jgi:hypothetical protein